MHSWRQWSSNAGPDVDVDKGSDKSIKNSGRDKKSGRDKNSGRDRHWNPDDSDAGSESESDPGTSANASEDRHNRAKNRPEAGDVYHAVDAKGGNVGGRNNKNNIHNMQETSLHDKLKTIKAMMPYKNKGAAHRAYGDLMGMKEEIKTLVELHNTLQTQLEQELGITSH